MGATEVEAAAPGGTDVAPGDAQQRQGETLARRLVALALALLLTAVSATLRIDTALEHPLIETAPANGLLKSDPALVDYITERILDAGGGVPEDFRADPRIQYPDLTDVPAEFTVGQEFLVAWTYPLFGRGEPLERYCIRAMGVTASLVVLAAFLLVLWRTGSSGWALLAAAIACFVPASYRTIGFVLVREDLSLPLFALHLALLGRAARRAERRAAPRAFFLAGLAAAGALATWHAMGFFLTLELLVLHLWFVASRRSPFELPGAWAVLVAPVAACVLVPALAANGALLGAPMLLAAALVVIALVRARFGRGTVAALAAGALCVAGVLVIERLVSGGGRGGYAHVADMLVAKVARLGERPVDPNEISFDARLLWQGPFESMSPAGVVAWIGGPVPFAFVVAVALLAVFARLRRARRGASPGVAGYDLFVAGLAVAAFPVACLVERTVVLYAILVPALVAVARAAPLTLGWRRAWIAPLLVALLLARTTTTALANWDLPWYRPPSRQVELAELVHWIEANVDPSEPIVGDFMSSPAILAHTRNPIVLQPKYETELSRRKAEEFLATFFSGTPDELRALVTRRFRARYLLVDRFTLGISGWTAGLVGEPASSSAAARMLSQDADVLTGIEGFELVYRSAAPSDVYRLYRVAPLAGDAR